MAPRVDDLLSHIYGPYAEHVLLRPDVPRPGVKLVMNDLALYFKDDPAITGFDETEFITNPPPGSRIAENPNVAFFGVIEIEDLDWLTDVGLKMLEADFAEMDRRMHLEHCQTKLTIKAYYTWHKKSDSQKLKVKICCRKTLLAHYMTSKNDFEKFLVYSEYEQKKRTYWIKTLNVGTRDASHKFIARYRLRAMIAELIEMDPKRTPLEERTVDWVVRRYFEEIIPRDKSRRFFKEYGHIYAPRRLRHFPKAQIRGYLAEHADWLLAHMIARRNGSANLLDIPQWISFCHEARRDSIEAAKAGVKWGCSGDLGDDMEGSRKLARRLARFGESERFWANQLRLIGKRTSLQTSTKTRELSPEALLPEELVMAPKTSFQYDSDFSDATCPDSEDSEDDSDSIIDVTPQFCLQEPHIRNGSFVWNCPGCSYQIDLLHLSPEDLAVLPPDTTRVLRSKAWKVSDQPIKRALFRMVSTHYEVQHLDREGVQVVQTSMKTWTVKQPRKVQSHTQVQKLPFIKVEEGDPQPLRRSNRTSQLPHRSRSSAR